jgi:hypothetical protein
MPKVVLKVIAVVLEHIVVLIFDLPAVAACGHDRSHGVISQAVVGGKGVMVELFARSFLHDGQLAPVHVQGTGAGAQGDVIDIAIAPQVKALAGSDAHGDLGDRPDAVEQSNLGVQSPMGSRVCT